MKSMNEYLMIIKNAQSVNFGQEFYLSESFLFLNKLMNEKHHSEKNKEKMILEVVRCLSILSKYKTADIFDVNIRRAYLEAWRYGSIDRYCKVAFYKLRQINENLEQLVEDYAQYITNSRTS